MQGWGVGALYRERGQKKRNMGTNGGRFRGASDMGAAIHLREPEGKQILKEDHKKC